mmetsp:Transcript_6420/g.11145  ORF Transcript_6420/g.11145 Transcript_6420/m.11145 type:complete len:124 (+) Transcript_6420:132-503(+)
MAWNIIYFYQLDCAVSSRRLSVAKIPHLIRNTTIMFLLSCVESLSWSITMKLFFWSRFFSKGDLFRNSEMIVLLIENDRVLSNGNSARNVRVGRPVVKPFLPETAVRYNDASGSETLLQSLLR